MPPMPEQPGAGDDLGKDADEDTNGTEDGAQGAGSGPILPGDDGKLGDAAALPELTAIHKAQRQGPEAAAQGEPPAGKPILEGQLSGAHGGLAPNQAPHDPAGHQKRTGLAAAGEKIGGILHLPTGEQAHHQDEPHHQYDPRQYTQRHRFTLSFLAIVVS